MDICLRRFRPSGAESLSLACPRESNQREGHPRGRAFRAPALQVRRRATGFFDSTSCADEKLARIPASHPAGFPSPTCRALCGPLAHIRVRTRCQRVALVERRGSCIHAQCHRVAVRAPDAPKGLCSRVTSDRRNAPVAAQDARLLVGAPRGRGRVGGKARREADTEVGLFFVSPWMGCRKTPPTLHALGGQDARQAPPRGALLFGYFLLGARKRK